MTTTAHTSSATARRRRNRNNNVLMLSYDDMLRHTFPEDYRERNRVMVRHPIMQAEINARVELYRQYALARLPIRYIPRRIRLTGVTAPDNP